MSAHNFMTDGDRRAEADRIAKARAPAYADGYQAGLMRAIEILTDGQGEFNALYDLAFIEALQIVIDAIGEEVEA